MIYDQMPIRIAANLASNPPLAPVDANTGQAVQFWRAQSTALQLAVFDANGDIVDLGNLANLTLAIQESQGSIAPVLVKSILASSITPTIAAADWSAGIAAQDEFDLSDSDTDFSLDGATSKVFWLTISGRTTGNATLVYAAGPITVFDPGLPAVQQNTSYVSRGEQANGGGNSVINPQSQIHTEAMTFSGAANERLVVLSSTGMVAGAQLSVLMNLPAISGLVVKFYDQSLAGNLLATINTTPDGFTPTAKAVFEYDGVNWNRDALLIPAFGQQAYGVVTTPGAGIVPPPTPYVSLHSQSNAAGGVSVVPTSPIHTEVVTVSGAAETRAFVLGASGMVKGAHISLQLVLPAVAGIIIQVYDQSVNGTLLTTITTTADGLTPAARAEFDFDGTNWNRGFLVAPAFGQQS